MTLAGITIVLAQEQQIQDIPTEPFTLHVVNIDIKPGRRRNIIELEDDDDDDGDDDDGDDDACEDDDDDRLRVAVLGTPDFDALTVDEQTVELGDPALGGTGTPIRSRIKDVNRDGRDDLLLIFTICDLVTSDALNRKSTELVLSGSSFDGIPIESITDCANPR